METLKTPRDLAAKTRPACPITTALAVIGGKWKPVILYQLRDGPVRFGVLRRSVPGATPKMLTQQLRELEGDGIVTRTVHAHVPPKVEYALSPYGQTLQPILLAMCAWGQKHRARADRRARRTATAKAVA